MKKIKVNAHKSYEIKIESGLVTRNELPPGFIITDENVAKIYADLTHINRFIIEAGEKSKSLNIYGKIIQELSKSDEQRLHLVQG